MSIHFAADFPAPPTRVLEIMCDELFLAAFADEVGVISHQAEVQDSEEGADITLRLVVPTTGVSPIFKRVVGDEVPIDMSRTWRSDGEGGFESPLHVKAKALGRTAHIRGSLHLMPTQHGSRFTAKGEVDLSIPIIGQRARAGVESLAGRVLMNEQQVMDRWLSQS